MITRDQSAEIGPAHVRAARSSAPSRADVAAAAGAGTVSSSAITGTAITGTGAPVDPADLVARAGTVRAVRVRELGDRAALAPIGPGEIDRLGRGGGRRRPGRRAGLGSVRGGPLNPGRERETLTASSP